MVRPVCCSSCGRTVMVTSYDQEERVICPECEEVLEGETPSERRDPQKGREAADGS